MDMELLGRIYNTLMLIRTSGEDTMIMGDCLKALKEWIEKASKAESEDKDKTPTAEEG
jgi:DNA modification methylase